MHTYKKYQEAIRKTVSKVSELVDKITTEPELMEAQKRELKEQLYSSDIASLQVNSLSEVT